MLKSEVKQTVDALGKEERTFLEAYLRVKNRTEDQQFAEESSKRLKGMKEGALLRSKELRELDQSLGEKGIRATPTSG